MPLDIKLALARMQSKRDHPRGSEYAYPQAVRQFNALLEAAKVKYPDRPDIRALGAFPGPMITHSDELGDSVQRLLDALETEPTGQGEAPLMHHKFGILRAESQLVADFDASTDLKAGVALVFFDIDEFKLLNTKYTESVVDRDFLAPFQRFLVDIVRHRGYCYSVGGDEFIILLLNCDRRESVAFAERLCQTLQDATFDCAGDEVQVTISLGVANYPGDGTSLEDVRAKANYAENLAKSKGKNRVVAYE